MEFILYKLYYESSYMNEYLDKQGFFFSLSQNLNSEFGNSLLQICIVPPPPLFSNLCIL